jgi:hypothetical protein
MADPIGLFSGVALVESPVLGSVLHSLHLSDDERRIAIDVNRDGYAVFEFSDRDLDARIDRIRAMFAPELGISSYDH